MAKSTSFFLIFLHIYFKVCNSLSCSTPSFPLILLSMCSSPSDYSINWSCCSWGLWWSSCSLPLRPINRRLSLHLFVCCICITGRASWWILSRLNGLLATNWWLSLILSLWMSCNVSLFPMPSPPHLHITELWFTDWVQGLAAEILLYSLCWDISIYLLRWFCLCETGKSSWHPHAVG